MEGKRRNEQMTRALEGKWGIALSFIFAVFLALTAFALCGLLGGGAVAWNTDTMDQMASISALLADKIRNGKNIFYSWDTSLGQNTALLFAFCAYSPMTLLYIIIPDVYTATMVGIVLRIGLTAALFHMFILCGMEWKSKWTCLFSLCYAFCGFQLEYMLSSNLMDGLYLLPLVMTFLMIFIKKGRFTGLVIAYALSFIIQFYCGFLIGLFSAVSLLVILYLRDGKRFISANVKLIVSYFLSVVCAVLMSMCVLLPALAFFRDSLGYDTVMVHEKIHLFEVFYSMCHARPTSLKTDIPFLYCGLPVLILLPLYFMTPKAGKKERIIMGAALAGLFVSLYADPVYFFLHAFNRPDGFTVRYAFLYVFLMLVISARCLISCRIEIKKENRSRFILLIVIVLLTALSVILFHDNMGEYADGKGVGIALLSNLILIPLWGAVFYMIFAAANDKNATLLAYALIFIELGGQAYLNVKEQGLLEGAWIRKMESQMELFKARCDEARRSDKEVYRAFAAAYPGNNQNARYGYMGIGQFASSNYSAVNRFMKKMGDRADEVLYSQAGATDLSDMLLGVRYRGQLNDTQGDDGGVFESYEYALPLGYMCSEDLLEDIAYNGDPFEYQNAVVSAMCGEEVRAYTRADVFGYEENMLTYQQYDNGYSIRNLYPGQSGDLLFGIPEAGYRHAYAFFNVFPYMGDKTETITGLKMATEIALFSVDDRKGDTSHFNAVIDNSIMEMSRDGNAFVISLADYEDPDKSFDYMDQYFYYQEEDAIEKAYKTLSQGAWSTAEWDETYIKASVSATQERPLLFMSIPYDKGWKVYADGDPLEVIPVIDSCFMALRLAPGEHEISLKYVVPGRKWGMILSAAGIILMIFMSFYVVIKKNMNHEK